MSSFTSPIKQESEKWLIRLTGSDVFVFVSQTANENEETESFFGNEIENPIIFVDKKDENKKHN